MKEQKGVDKILEKNYHVLARNESEVKQMRTMRIEIDVDRESVLGKLDEIERLARNLLVETESVRHELAGKSKEVLEDADAEK